ncbi:MAG: prepilin-type N-terminal cleavage/methylation domain-containing protein [candidate division WOR-3 bacterium]
MYPKNRGFTLVELLVVIMILGVLMGMSVPRFSGLRNQARIAAMKMNLHNVQTAIEVFHQEFGYYAEDFYEDGYGCVFPGGEYDVRIGKLPTNPYSGKEMDPDEFNPEDYDDLTEISNTDEYGPNDVYGYDPGNIVYKVYDPPGSANPTHYGLLGIDHSGSSIRDFDADGDAVIFVLHN